MFPLPYASPVDGILYFFFGLEIVLLLGGLLLGKPDADRTCHLPRPLRMSLSSLLLLSAFLGWRVAAYGTRGEHYALLILLGMAAGFLGDLIMARVIPTPSRIIFGMGAFGIGHCFYLAALWSLVKSVRLPTVGLIALWGGALGLSALAWLRYVRVPRGNRALNAASLLYALLIGNVTSLACALAWSDARFVALAIGAVLFLTSDLILGNWIIRGHLWTSVNDVIWTTYVGGQLLIVHSVAAVLKVL